MSDEKTSERGLRYNAGKPRHALISAWAMEGLALVLTKGAVKYTTAESSGDHNWRKGLSWQDTIDSLKRHLNAFERGIDIDDGPEGSGLPHIDLLMCNAMFLSEFQKLARGKDDRWKP